jgi:hypothetical protein
MANETPKTARYFSGKYRNLTIAVKSAYYKVIEDKKVLVDGKRVVFIDGYFETNDENLVSELEARPDFNKVFSRIPENKTVDQLRDSAKVISEKDREIAALKAENEKLKLGKEEGGSTEPLKKEVTPVDETMKRADLEAIAEGEGLTADEIEAASNKAELVAAIEANRAKSEEDEAF